AQMADVTAGDVITSINSESIKDNRDLSRKVIGLAPGTSVDVGVLHDGKEKTLAITLGAFPVQKRAPAGDPTRSSPRPATAPGADLGLKLAPAASMPSTEQHGV